jgi:hypothetical protein
MEVIDIDIEDLDLDNTGSNNGAKSSVNFGSGIELLMNEKKKSSSGSTRINLDELSNLENELNALSGNTPSGPSGDNRSSGDNKKISGFGFGDFFNFGGSSSSANEKHTELPTDSNLGTATAESISGTAAKTWDGFMKMGAEVPLKSNTTSSANMTERERRRKKRLMIKKLEEWYERGTIKNHSHFNMDSNYEEVEDEYEGALEDKRKKDSIKLQGWWFTTVINTIEYGNTLLNPFDLNLDGWGEQVSEDIDSYEEIFSELHEKYKGGKMAPELSLLLRVAFSAAVVNMSNKMLSSATPGFSDVMKQSPELMRMFTNAAVDTMSKQSPTFEFAKNMMNPAEQVNTRPGPPPAPVETKKMGTVPRPNMPASSQPAVGSTMHFTTPVGTRPDLAAANPMFRESGIDVSNPYESTRQEKSSILRPEMKGPQPNEIDQILSGLKLKPSSSNMNSNGPSANNNSSIDNREDSMISLSSIQDLNSVNMPKKSRRPRQNKSDKNTVSLDI